MTCPDGWHIQWEWPVHDIMIMIMFLTATKRSFILDMMSVILTKILHQAGDMIIKVRHTWHMVTLSCCYTWQTMPPLWCLMFQVGKIIMMLYLAGKTSSWCYACCLNILGWWRHYNDVIPGWWCHHHGSVLQFLAGENIIMMLYLADGSIILAI